METLTSVIIPLYRSARFIDSIIANIDAMPSRGVEILISDRHCLDDTIERLAKRYADDARVRCLRHRDELDWVSHINKLLEEARGDYWRFLPHDDLSPAGSLEALMSALDTNPDAILAYGPTRAIDADGQPLPDRDRPAPHPDEARRGWTLGLALQMYWKGFFDGAFKGLIRRRTVMEDRLLIRATQGQIYPERCWLFALCLLGRFHFVPDALYVKRFHAESLHAGWKITGRHFLDAAGVMSGYLRDVIGPGHAYWYGSKDLWLNAHCFARWMDNPRGKAPVYQPAPFAAGDTIRDLPLPGRNARG